MFFAPRTLTLFPCIEDHSCELAFALTPTLVTGLTKVILHNGRRPPFPPSRSSYQSALQTLPDNMEYLTLRLEHPSLHTMWPLRISTKTGTLKVRGRSRVASRATRGGTRPRISSMTSQW